MASQKYVLLNERRTWTGAQSYCREKYTDLVSVRNEAERQWIVSLSRIDVWIGLHRNRLWSDQSSSSFTYWLPLTQSDVAQPDNGLNIKGQTGVQSCTAVSLQHFGQWTDERCLASLPFFCYNDPSSQPNHSTQPQPNQEYVMGMRVKVTSADNLSESQIVELITPLQEELIRLGLPSNVSMHLRGYRKINP
ncbi:aggrecan core protein isoform X2 [Labeo rohita]|uniref:aggrecan core protein isoform X2 n=1 Tax=Labeo rohita TaxID=84645 RepID=UPI0021E2326B|nr:aggrecan core protein isoform X2 [Labeo rohita]